MGAEAMNPQQEIEAALGRLELHSHSATIGLRPIGKPLAALIRKAARPVRTALGEVIFHSCGVCRYRGTVESEPVDHLPDCALLALCRAINGEQP